MATAKSKAAKAEVDYDALAEEVAVAESEAEVVFVVCGDCDTVYAEGSPEFKEGYCSRCGYEMG